MICFQLFSIVVFACIASQGYAISPHSGRRYCLYNENPNACNYGIAIGVIAFLASMGFLAGEYLFEQMSSVKSRKHYVLADLGFHSLWAFMYFIGFCYLANQWSASAEPPLGYSSSNVKTAIAFCFFSVFTCVSLKKSSISLELVTDADPILECLRLLCIRAVSLGSGRCHCYIPFGRRRRW